MIFFNVTRSNFHYARVCFFGSCAPATVGYDGLNVGGGCVGSCICPFWDLVCEVYRLAVITSRRIWVNQSSSVSLSSMVSSSGKKNAPDSFAAVQ